MASRSSQTADDTSPEPPRLSNDASRWQPILGDAECGAVRAALESIAVALTDTDVVRLFGPSWCGGSAGVSLFLGDLAHATGDRRWHDGALAWLAHSAEHALDDGSDLSLFSGLAGIAWASEPFRAHRVDTHPSGLQRLADERLLEHLGQLPWQGDYDLYRGLVGYGVYALSRLGHPTGPFLLERIVDRLAETAIETDDGITWWTAPEFLRDQAQRRAYPEGCFNLGLAHGVPGVIALLGQVCAAKVKIEITRPLLAGAVDWLLAQRLPDSATSCFATHVSNGRPPAETVASRVAWCYGDLGLAAALYMAATCVHEPRWEAEALAVARHAARRPLKASGVRDATLCHGSAGNGHMFNRFYQATGEQVFLDAARRWFGFVFDTYRPGTGVGGFTTWIDEPEPARTLLGAMPGVLQGAAGVGLALLTSISSVTPQWDVPLLIAFPQ